MEDSMKKIIEKLETKWNAFENDKFYLKQCDTSNGKEQTYLNVLFYAVDIGKLQGVQEAFCCKIHPELKRFYESFNGIMLFSESLRIYGIESNDDALYDPYDIVEQNKNDSIQNYGDKYANFVVFGYYSYCLFCFDKTDFSYLYVFDTRQEEIVYKFKKLSDLLSHYVDYLYNEYDNRGMKIHFDKSLKGLPVANVSTEFI